MDALTMLETSDGPMSWITDLTSWRRVAKSWLSCSKSCYFNTGTANRGEKANAQYAYQHHPYHQSKAKQSRVLMKSQPINWGGALVLGGKGKVR